MSGPLAVFDSSIAARKVHWPGTAVAQSLAEGSLTEVELVGAGPIERRMVMVEHQGSRGQPETVAYFVSLLLRIPELIPRARPVHGE